MNHIGMVRLSAEWSESKKNCRERVREKDGQSVTSPSKNIPTANHAQQSGYLCPSTVWNMTRCEKAHTQTHGPRVEEHKSSSSRTDTLCAAKRSVHSSLPRSDPAPTLSWCHSSLHAASVICLVAALESSCLVGRSVSAHACDHNEIHSMVIACSR